MRTENHTAIREMKGMIYTMHQDSERVEPISKGHSRDVKLRCSGAMRAALHGTLPLKSSMAGRVHPRSVSQIALFCLAGRKPVTKRRICDKRHGCCSACRAGMLAAKLYCDWKYIII